MKRRASNDCNDNVQNNQELNKNKHIKEKRVKKHVSFKSVQVLYFNRQQGFTCVPSQGGSTLGMSKEHHDEITLNVDEYLEMRKDAHYSILLDQNSRGTLPSHFPRLTLIDDKDKILESVEDYYFLQPVPTRQRRLLLRAAGVKKVEVDEKEECKEIRESRERCGCSCPNGMCLPETCECAKEGIQCQVDRQAFPCNCVQQSCVNSNGRVEFNPLRVRSHFIHTLMRLELQKTSDDFGRSSNMPFNSNERGSCCDCQNWNLSRVMMKEVKNHQDSFSRVSTTTSSNTLPSLQIASQQPIKLDPISAILQPVQNNIWSIDDRNSIIQTNNLLNDTHQLLHHNAFNHNQTTIDGREFTELLPASTENSQSYSDGLRDDNDDIEKSKDMSGNSNVRHLSSNFGEIIKETMVETVSA